MRKEEIFLHLKNFLIEEFEKEPSLIELDKGLVDIGMDSLDAFDFFTMISEKYGIELDQKMIMELTTVNDVVEFIAKNAKN
jgi:acyl carrier protein